MADFGDQMGGLMEGALIGGMGLAGLGLMAGMTNNMLDNMDGNRPAQQQQLVKCPKCKSLVGALSQYCPRCGRRLRV